MESPHRLLSPQEVKEACHREKPVYAASISDEEWERIAERLEAVGRLLGKFSKDQAMKQSHKKVKGPSSAHPKQDGQTESVVCSPPPNLQECGYRPAGRANLNNSIIPNEHKEKPSRGLLAVF